MLICEDGKALEQFSPSRPVYPENFCPGGAVLRFPLLISPRLLLQANPLSLTALSINEPTIFAISKVFLDLYILFTVTVDDLGWRFLPTLNRAEIFIPLKRAVP